MKYPPSAEEVEARHKDSYREQVNRSEIRCHGVAHPLDKYTVLRDKHYTLGINLPTNPFARFNGQRFVLSCDDCLSAQREALDQYLEEHPLESYGEPRKGVRLFYYKDALVGEHHLSNFSLRNGTTFRFTYPNTYKEFRISQRKSRDIYGRPAPSRKPTPLLSFDTSEEFYAYLDSILESETHQP